MRAVWVQGGDVRPEPMRRHPSPAVRWLLWPFKRFRPPLGDQCEDVSGVRRLTRGPHASCGSPCGGALFRRRRPALRPARGARVRSWIDTPPGWLDLRAAGRRWWRPYAWARSFTSRTSARPGAGWRYDAGPAPTPPGNSPRSASTPRSSGSNTFKTSDFRSHDGPSFRARS